MAITLEDIKRAGFPSFFALYQHFKQTGMVFKNSEPVEIGCTSWSFTTVGEVKALAMDEVYTMLPGAVDIQRLIRYAEYNNLPAELLSVIKNLPYKL